jgi:hypothetical protein
MAFANYCNDERRKANAATNAATHRITYMHMNARYFLFVSKEGPSMPVVLVTSGAASVVVSHAQPASYGIYHKMVPIVQRKDE